MLSSVGHPPQAYQTLIPYFPYDMGIMLPQHGMDFYYPGHGDPCGSYGDHHAGDAGGCHGTRESLPPYPSPTDGYWSYHNVSNALHAGPSGLHPSPLVKTL